MADIAALRLCPGLLTTSACSDPSSCSYTHNFRLCHSCGVIVRPENAYNSHAATMQHQERVHGNFVRCHICETTFVRGDWESHVSGESHVMKAASRGLQARVLPETPAFVPDHKLCAPCNIFVRHAHWRTHQSRGDHKQKANFSASIAAYVESTRMEAQDVDGVVQVNCPGGIDFGVIDEDSIRRSATTRLIISTSSRTLRLAHVKATSPQTTPRNKPFVAEPQGSSLFIKAGVQFYVIVSFNPDPPHVGVYTGQVKLVFHDTQSNKTYPVARLVKAKYGDPLDHEELRPTAPYVPPKRTARPQMRKIIWSKRPPRFDRNPYKIKIDDYPIPAELNEALDKHTKDVGETIFAIPYDYKPQSLHKNTYTKNMTSLLWIEERQARIDIQMYDMEDVRLHKEKGRYLLHVPGLAESRPSVLLGDGILIQAQDMTDGDWFEGIVMDLRSEEVALQLPAKFKGWSASRRYAVRFSFNRYPLRRQHQALHQPFNDDRIFFPLARHVKAVPPYVADIDPLYNDLIEVNPPQLLAVKTIVRLPQGSHPFIVYGPPGTGKTFTCVEAILQLLLTQPSARIFACAPSNSAADVLATRLLGALGTAGVTMLYRFYAPSRATGTAPKELLPCTTRASDGAFSVPILEHVLRFRVVVSTCGSASFAYGIGVPAGHFSHIFVDEAGQGTEPETMVPIKTLADAWTNVVLSGDPKQLGPVIRSAVAKELGLGKSYLERLMQHQVYDEKTGHGKTIVKLTKNFRSHPDILHYPNQVFYAGDLRPHGKPAIINAYSQWSRLPKKGFPIIFHAVEGEDKREASSPSYFNIDEITQVKKYVKMLLEDKKVPIKAADIGVITPYHAQAMKMRAALRSMTPSARDAQVASVELFQGQERRVIIMSTVRSTQDMMVYDVRHALGFVSNPRRFNVAITRAQALLILVGNPAILSLDPLWRDFLNWIFAHGGWAGPHPSWDAAGEARQKGESVAALGLEDINDYAQRMEALRLDAASNDDIPVDEHGWREEE